MADFQDIVNEAQRLRRIGLLEKKVSHLLRQLNVDESQIDLEFQTQEKEAELQSRAKFRSDLLFTLPTASVGAICGGVIGSVLWMSLLPELGWEMGAIVGAVSGAFLGPFIAWGVRDGIQLQ